MPKDKSFTVHTVESIEVELITLCDKDTPKFRERYPDEYYVRVTINAPKCMVVIRDIKFPKKEQAEEHYDLLKVAFRVPD